MGLFHPQWWGWVPNTQVSLPWLLLLLSQLWALSALPTMVYGNNIALSSHPCWTPWHYSFWWSRASVHKFISLVLVISFCSVAVLGQGLCAREMLFLIFWKKCGVHLCGWMASQIFQIQNSGWQMKKELSKYWQCSGSRTVGRQILLGFQSFLWAALIWGGLHQAHLMVLGLDFKNKPFLWLSILLLLSLGEGCCPPIASLLSVLYNFPSLHPLMFSFF